MVSQHLLKSQLREESSNLHESRTRMHRLVGAPAFYRVCAHTEVLTRLCHARGEGKVRRAVLRTEN